jgi:NAD(P)-dependent dehydrogenase (short-subunit alcohol dehydrogenase family)
MDVTYNFSGKIALVTGGGSGIGRASSEAFGRAGAVVVVADISESNGRETVESIRNDGGTAEFFSVNVAEVEQVDRLIQEVVARYGRIDFAHNNAGIEGMHVPLINSSQTSGNTWYLQAAVTRTVADTDPHLRTNSTWSP